MRDLVPSNDELARIFDLEVEQRLGNMLRTFPVQDIGKKESDYRSQIVSFCEALVTEQQHPDSELSSSTASVASMVVDLLALGDVVALQRGATQLEKFNKEENPGPVVAFFSKHKVGQSLTQASAEVMVEGAARVELEKAVQDASLALGNVKAKTTAGEEELSKEVTAYLEHVRVVKKEIAEMKKQGMHTLKATTKATLDLTKMNLEFWQWLNKALRNEMLNTLCGVLENCALVVQKAQKGTESAPEFTVLDMQEVLRNDEVLKHPLWQTPAVAAELKTEKKVLKLFEFYGALAEQVLDLAKFALGRTPSTHWVFQGAALPPIPPPETLRKFQGLPEQLCTLADGDKSLCMEKKWAVLLCEVDQELSAQQNAGFMRLGLLVGDFLEKKEGASKAKLEEVKLMVPQKCEGRKLLDSTFQAPLEKDIHHTHSILGNC